LDFSVASFNVPENGGPLPFFQQKEVRQAVAACIDRQALAGQLFFGQSQAPDSYVSAEHPLFNANVRRYGFDPAEAGKLLDAAGWLDADGNPATPRVSQGVAGVADGTPFEVTLLTSDEDEKQRAAQAMQVSLAQCGIKLDISASPAETVFAAGPEGPIFGRNFHLAQFGWVSPLEPPCRLYTSAEIPGPYPDFSKGWGGANASGYSNPEFDRLCQAALTALPGSPERLAAHQAAQAIFAEDLPALPLYARLKLAVTRPDFCGADLDPSSESPLWNLERFDYGEACGQ
jgi:peptide/nickel transport system substrate-binding protein